MKWEKRKNNIICWEITILFVIALFAVLCIYNPKGVCSISRECDSFSLTLLGIQATITTLTLALIALLSGVIGKSYFGVSISTFYLERRPFILKQKHVIIIEFLALAVSVIEFKKDNDTFVFFMFMSCLLIILYSILGVYQIFKGKRLVTDEMRDYVEFLMETDSDYKSVGENFINDWKELVLNQSKEEFLEYCGFFNILVRRILSQEQDIETLNKLTENFSLYLLNHESEACRIKGIIFVEDYYENVWQWSNDNEELLASIKGTICLMDRICSDICNSISTISVEQLQRTIKWEAFSTSVLEVNHRIGYVPGEWSYDISALYSLGAKFGDYLKQQALKNSLISRKYWESIVTNSYGIVGGSGNYEDHFKETIARRDFNVCRGYLLNGLVDIVKNGVFLDGAKNCYHVDSEADVLRFMLIHSYMYYLAYGETEECINKELQDDIRKLITDKEVVASVTHFYFRVAESNMELTASLGVKLEKILSNYELYPLHSNSKAVIIDRVIRRYYFFATLFISLYSLNVNRINSMLDVARYSQYLSTIERPRLLEDMMGLHNLFVPNLTEEINKSIVEKLLVSFDSTMKPKYKQIVIEKAAEEQREYEVNGVQECVEEKIKVYLQNKFEETFSSYAENICDNIKTYSDIKLLPIWEFTKIIGEDDISRIYRDNPTSAICKWLVNVLENDFGVRRFNRDNSLSDHAFEKMLDDNKLDCLLGSTYSFGVEDYNYYKNHSEYLKQKECHFLPGVNAGVASSKGVLYVKLNSINVSIYSPTVDEIGVEKNSKTNIYTYSSGGIDIDYEEKEIRELIHDEYKSVSITYDVTVGVNQTDEIDSCLLITRDINI